MLTRKQHTLLTYICKFIREEGVAPSCEEMRVAMGLKSKSGVHRLVSALTERGYVRRLPHRARAMEVVRAPSGEQPVGAPRPLRVISGGEEASVALAARAAPRWPASAGASLSAAPDPQGRDAPVRGRIAAGAPLEAIQREDMGALHVPRYMLHGVRGEIFALEVDGDSMKDAGILDGDMAILESVSTARDNQIVVALVEGSEATLKRFRPLHGGAVVALEAANPEYPTRTYAAAQVEVQGRLIGVIRRY